MNIDTRITIEEVNIMLNIIEKNKIDDEQEKGKILMMWGAVCNQNRYSTPEELQSMINSFCVRHGLKYK